jgi:hypothetical protein
MSIFNSPKFDPLGNSNQVGATNMNKISVAQDAATLRAGVGTRMQYTPSGMVISANRQRSPTPAKYPFNPIFSYDENGTLVVMVEPSYLGSNLHELGQHEYVVPSISGAPIVNPDPNDTEWIAPSVEMSSGGWTMWMTEGVSSVEVNQAVIEIIKSSGTAPEPNPSSKNTYALAAWNVIDNDDILNASAVEAFAARSITHTVTPLAPFQPALWHDGTNYKARFEPANVTVYKTGSALPVTVSGGSMEDSDGETVSNGDEWWVKITTDDLGTPSAADLQVAVTPTHTQFAEGFDNSGTPGEYWFKVCTFALEDNLMIPTMHLTGDIPWNPRPWSNVGTGENVIKEFADGVYEARTLSAKDVEPTGTPETVTGDTKIYDVYVEPEIDGDEIKFTGKVELPDGLTHPWKATEPGTVNISIAAGEIMGIRAPTISEPSGDIVPYYVVPVSYAGGDIEVTSATGYIYAVATTTESVIHLDTYDFVPVNIQTQTRKTTSISVSFSADSPSTISSGSNDEVWVPVCQVALAGGVASVTKQILTHNPILTIEIAEAV